MSHYPFITTFRVFAWALPACSLILGYPAGGQRTNRQRPASARPNSNKENAVPVLRRMVAAYKAARTLSQTTESDQLIAFSYPINNRQTTTLVYQQQPARLAKRTSDRVQGIVDYVADGKQLVITTNTSHVRITRATQNNLASICRAMEAESVQILTPVSFLAQTDTPSYLTNVQSGPTEILDGKPVLVVRCRFTPAFLNGLGSRLKLPDNFQPIQQRVTLWIDPQSSFLMKAELHIAWRGVVKYGKTNRQLIPTLDGTERVTKIVVNQPLDQSQFQPRPTSL